MPSRLLVVHIRRVTHLGRLRHTSLEKCSTQVCIVAKDLSFYKSSNDRSLAQDGHFGEWGALSLRMGHCHGRDLECGGHVEAAQVLWHTPMRCCSFKSGFFFCSFFCSWFFFLEPNLDAGQYVHVSCESASIGWTDGAAFVRVRKPRRDRWHEISSTNHCDDFHRDY